MLWGLREMNLLLIFCSILGGAAWLAAIGYVLWQFCASAFRLSAFYLSSLSINYIPTHTII
jgi:hypothetical protein